MRYYHTIHWQQADTTFGGAFTGISRFRWLARFLAHRQLRQYRLQRGLSKSFLRIVKETCHRK